MPLKNAVPVALNHCAAAPAVQLDGSDGARASRVVARGAHAGVAAPASDAYVNQRVHATVAPAERSPAPPTRWRWRAHIGGKINERKIRLMPNTADHRQRARRNRP